MTNIDNVEQKAALLLFNYLKDELDDIFSMYDFISKVEHLRSNKTNDEIKNKWLSYILSIYPTKYFIKSTIFSISYYERNNNTDFSIKQIKKIELINKINSLEPIFKEDNFNNYDWDLLNQIGLNCNTPILNSAVEWCVNPYLKDITQCPPEYFFSGFYENKPTSIEYGLFRTPEELGMVVDYIDNKIATDEGKIPLYKNVIENITPPTYFRGGGQYYHKYLKYKKKYLSLKNN